MSDYNNESCDSKTIRQGVFALLKENSKLSPKRICVELHLPYPHYGPYVNNLKSHWKSKQLNEEGSNCSSVHNWRCYCQVPLWIDRVAALEVGWVETRSKNHWLLFKNDLGRLMWFKTGKVNIYVKSPGNLGKGKQLVCQGFGNTGLIYEDLNLVKVLESIKYWGAHHVIETGQKLPKQNITTFAASHGLTIKTGDKSHPHAIEIEERPPDWINQIADSLAKIANYFDDSLIEKKAFDKKPDYLV
jgi:hypothetical protein